MKHNPSEPVDQSAAIASAEQERDLTAVELPPYAIVASCKTLGFYQPLDCFWSRIESDSPHASKEQITCSCADHRRIGSRWSGLRASAPINVYIHRCLFNDADGASIYRMGQCPACHAIYWMREEPAA
jgi:hypothetical protein